MDAKKMMARKSRIGSIQDIISSETMWPWEETRAPAKKHPSSIETSNSSVICQGITENLLLFSSPEWLYIPFHCETIRLYIIPNVGNYYVFMQVQQQIEFSVFISVFCSIIFIQKTHKTSFPSMLPSFPTKTKINFLIYMVMLCVTLTDSIWFHKNEKD